MQIILMFALCEDGFCGTGQGISVITVASHTGAEEL